MAMRIKKKNFAHGKMPWMQYRLDNLFFIFLFCINNINFFLLSIIFIFHVYEYSLNQLFFVLLVMLLYLFFVNYSCSNDEVGTSSR